jgi:hypothetical protein
MTVPRCLLVLMMMVMVGLTIVAIRGESAKAANRVQRLHLKQMDLEQSLWTHEMELAKLRGPDEIRRRTSELGLDLIPPLAEQPDPKGSSKNSNNRGNGPSPAD